MIPVSVSTPQRSYAFRVAANPSLLPLLAAYIVQTTATTRGRKFGNQTLSIRLEAAYADGESFHLGEAIPAGDAPAQAAALTAAVFGYLGAVPFTAPPLERIAIRLDTVERTVGASLIDAVPERTAVRAGDRLRVRTRWRVRRGPILVRDFSIRVPESVPPGRLDLVVADGGAWTAYDLRARPLRPASFADELRLLGRIVPSTSAVVALERRDSGAVLEGGTISVPPSVLLSLQAGLDGNVAPVGYSVAARETADLGMPLRGAVRLRLVVRRDGVERRRPSTVEER